MKYKLFTTPSCKSCPAVKNFVSTLSLDVELIDASTEQGREQALKYGVRSVPTMLFFENEQLEKPIATAQTVRQIEEVLTTKT